MDYRKILAATAAVIGTVAMADGIVSSSVVGYQNLELDTTGRNFIGATFLPISSSMTLGDVSVNDKFVPISDTLYTINGYGGVAASYYYVDAETAEAFGGSAGWYLDSDIDNWDGESELVSQNNVTLSVGQMVCVSASEAEAAIVFAGAVADEDVTLVLDTTARNFLVNCTPVNITLGDITVNDKFVPISDTLYTMNGYGGVAASYYYVDAETAEAFGGSAGWYLDSDIDNWDGESTIVSRNDVEIAAGQGFVASASEAGAGVIIPSAL